MTMPREIILIAFFVVYILGWGFLAFVAERDQKKQANKNKH